MEVRNSKIYARLRDEQFSVYENYARRHGLNSKSMLVLMWIYYNPQGITQENISKKTFSTKQVIQAIIKTYINKGLVILEENKQDKRKKNVKLTEKGTAFASRLLDPLEKYEDEAMKALSISQQEAVLEGTRIFSEKLYSLLLKHEATSYDESTF